MVTDKKPSKPVSKDQKKSKSKKTLKLVKSANSSKDVPSLSGLSAQNIEPPDGFRVVSITQALMEYSGPLVKTVSDRTDIVKVNEIFSVAAAIWDYTSDDKSRRMNKKSKPEILALIQQRLGLNPDQADDFFSMMVERKNFLFPCEIQPLDESIMFMCKELSYLVNTFDYERLKGSPETIHPTPDDLKVIHNLNRLDKYIARSADYNEYEELLFEVQRECFMRFDIWLSQKGIIEHHEEFTFFTDTYLTFIYGCDHKEPITIKNVYEEYIVEFMMDFVLNRTTMEPLEYTLVPAAMILFHIYLYEKGYLDEPPDGIVDFMDELESEFIEKLKKRFS